MGSSQNSDPILLPRNIRCRTIIYNQQGPGGHNFVNNPRECRLGGPHDKDYNDNTLASPLHGNDQNSAAQFLSLS